MSNIPSPLPIPRVQDAFAPAGEPTDNGFDSRAKGFFGEPQWHADALKTARQHGVRTES
jgi:hypothetical protein